MNDKPYPLRAFSRWTAAALAGALVAGLTLAERAVPSAAADTAAVAEARRLGDAFSEVADKVSPSVVSLAVEAKRGRGQSPLEFFAPFGGPRSPGIAKGTGSGVIVRADGYILTNNHVVDGAERIDVRLQNGRRYQGKVSGSDPATDLAVVKIDAQGLAAARFGSADAARTGQWVIAIGSPFGLEYTVTTGVLSAKGRGGLGAAEIEDYLQTDASINPGNSGGPLVSLDGEVLGINTMIVGRGTGIGMAIPAELAKHVAGQIIEHGEVRRAWIGVSFQEVTPELAAHFGRTQSGALVANVVHGGPAEQAGIEPGDIIVAVNEKPVEEGRDLLRTVLRHKVGERIELKVVRKKQLQTFAVRTGERPGDTTASRSASDHDAESAHDRGLSLRKLTPQLKAQIGYEGNGNVVVTKVRPGSSAQRAGLKPGDVIVEANRRKVQSTGDVAEALRSGKALLRIERGEGGLYVVIGE